MLVRLFCAVFLIAIASACERKPGGQSLAVVNGQEITSAELNAELRNADLPPTSSPAQARARILESLIDRKLLVQQAQADGIDKSPEFLNQQRRMNDYLLINLLISRQLRTAPVPSADDIRKFQESRPGMFAQREIWTLEQLQYSTPTDEDVLERIRAATSIDGVAQALSAGRVQFSRRNRQVDSADLPPEMYSQITALRPGEPFIVPAGEQSVASGIVERQPAPRTGDEAQTIALNSIREAQAEKIRQERAQAARAAAKIEYQSGFEPKRK